MRSRAAGLRVAALIVAAVTLAGCAGDPTPPPPAPTPTVAATEPAYDDALEPAAAVLALVPDVAVTLSVTDYDQVRADLGVDTPTTAVGTNSPVAEQEAFWSRAGAESPLLSAGLLRAVDDRLRADYALSQLDVSWEAHFFAADGAELGWVMALRRGVLATSVQRAVTDGVGALAGSAWRPEDGLIVRGVSDDGFASWAADADTAALVGLPATATLLERACLPRAQVPTTLTELTAYSVQFESGLATARLGPGRADLFDRLRLATSFAPFIQAYDGGVADPRTGRIGFVMSDPPLAAELALRGELPFAACADD